MKEYKWWTSLEIKKLQEMLADDIPYSAIARKLDRSIDSIHGKIRTIRYRNGIEKLPRIHKPNELAKKVKLLCIPGVPDRVVGEILGVTRTMIRTTRKRLGIPNQCEANKKFPRDITKTSLSVPAKILWLYSGVGRTIRQIADKLCVVYYVVRDYLDKFKLGAIRKTEYIHPKERQKLAREANRFKPRVYSIGTL